MINIRMEKKIRIFKIWKLRKKRVPNYLVNQNRKKVLGGYKMKKFQNMKQIKMNKNLQIKIQIILIKFYKKLIKSKVASQKFPKFYKISKTIPISIQTMIKIKNHSGKKIFPSLIKKMKKKL